MQCKGAYATKGATMRRVMTTVAICMLSIGWLASTAHADPDSADLTVSIAWSGNGAPRAHVGQSVPYTVTATNRGPDTAQQVRIGLGLPDQLNPDSANCGTGVQQSTTECTFASLASGQSVTVSFVAVVCCLPKQESREASATATVDSATPDPNLDNNVQSRPTRIIGAPGFSFPG